MKAASPKVEVQVLVPEAKLAEFYALVGRWYHAEEPLTAPRARESRGRPAGSGRRYQPLTHHLQGADGNRLELAFQDIDDLLGTELPGSARKFRTFWANSDTPQGRAWLGAGWRVVTIDFAGDKVVFAKD